MALPVVPIDSANEKQHRAVIATSLNELVKFFNTIKSGTWTAVVRGSGTAGTYEITINNCRYTRIGRRVFLDLAIVMDAVVTGGGTGTLNITGIPYAKIANSFPVGAARLSGIDIATAGASLCLCFTSLAADSTLQLSETVDNSAVANVAISGIAANDGIFASICYETEDL